MYTYKTTVIKIELHKIGNIVWKIHKIHKHIILSYFDNLQVRSLVRTGIFFVLE